jgi:hypothetical protein
MIGGRDEGIVVDVIDPIRGKGPFPNEDVGMDHPVGVGVVTQWLELQHVVEEEVRALPSLVDIVGIDVETSALGDVTQSKVVASHCRVVAQIKGRDVRAAKFSRDKMSGVVVIEKEPPEALPREWFPTVEALEDIRRDVIQVIPELDNRPRDTRWATWGCCREIFLNELVHRT